MEDLVSHLVADPGDEKSHRDAGHRVAPAQAEGNGDQPDECTQRGQRVEQRMLAVGDKGGRLDPFADVNLEPRHHLVAEHADRRRRDPRRQVGRGGAADQLLEALVAGEDRARPDHQRHPQPGEVFSALETVRVPRRRRPLGDSKAEEHHQRGGNVAEVVKRVAE